MENKYIKGLAVAALALCLSTGVNAQEKKKEGLGKKIEKGAQAVGNKTAEVTVKGGAKIVDQKYKGKIAPDGSNVYIDGKNNKYYINKKGAKIYLKASEIRNKRVN